MKTGFIPQTTAMILLLSLNIQNNLSGNNKVMVSSLAFTHPTQIYSIRKGQSTSKTSSTEQHHSDSSNSSKNSRSHSSGGSVSDSSTCLGARQSKWDNLVDEDEEEEVISKQNTESVPTDMIYDMTNMHRQNKNFQMMTQVGGDDTINDLYIREPNTQVFWFVGKVSRCTGTVSLEQAVQRQWHLIEQHASRLRAKELGPHFGILEIWTAPGNSELDVAYNRPNVQMQKMERSSDATIHKTVKNSEVGFEGELYQNGEEGFRTLRNEDGFAVKKEIVAPEQDLP
mmetsp:Transcript_16348/g.23975  ORF Transcript_16348/g.23975 Transcript_16348/m.23975 type:complete len:284 (+) Transcript_16348:239-1090(+)|eukprot:CAMPEP_0195508926 /NCGR_PEP_ID=MMETSP0794_2-20130614/2004_1 /TAXON_ID=515487 /ORGANISM="Stephanopyxis turris, Strain CCMP 815" /LENGTH=283 /DNA_ID=CAMNT_0040636023 /DNA_START=233 /DNA_END=1084 /DNA_ORIENTATION=+